LRLSIRSKLIAYAFFIAFLVGGGISVYSIYIGHERLMRNFEENSRHITGLLAATIFDDLYFSNLQALRLLVHTTARRIQGFGSVDHERR
jgi:Kef-type K+ transport system membrane component KefB